MDEADRRNCQFSYNLKCQFGPYEYWMDHGNDLDIYHETTL